MLRSERHGDVVRLHLTSRRSRLAGFGVSAFLVREVLVDCGFPGVGEDVARLLDHGRLGGVIVTHWHEDHAGNVEAVARRGIPIATHPETLARVRNPAALRLYRRLTWGAPVPLVSPVAPLDPAPLMLLPTPGHTDDHHAVWDAETRTLFAADLFIGVKVRVAHASERPRALAESLRRVLALEPQRVFDAHRGLLDHGAAALRAKLAWTDEMIGRVERLAGEGLSPESIARTVLGKATLTERVSAGEYSRINLVRAVLAEGGTR